MVTETATLPSALKRQSRRDSAKREELSRRLEQVENLVQVQVSDVQTNNNDIKLINEKIDRCAEVTEYLGEQVSELGVALEAVAGMFGRTNCSEDEEESCMSTTRGDGLRTGEVPVGAGASLKQGRRRESTGTNAPETMFTSADLRGVDTGSNPRRVQAV